MNFAYSLFIRHTHKEKKESRCKRRCTSFEWYHGQSYKGWTRIYVTTARMKGFCSHLFGNPRYWEFALVPLWKSPFCSLWASCWSSTQTPDAVQSDRTPGKASCNFSSTQDFCPFAETELRGRDQICERKSDRLSLSQFSEDGGAMAFIFYFIYLFLVWDHTQ